MNVLHKTLLACAVILISSTLGCKTSSRSLSPSASTPCHYHETELKLSIAQEAESSDLLLTLKNITSIPITNLFPQGRFEGSFWMVQEGLVPIKEYPSDYLNLLLHAPWFNPSVVIQPGSEMTYHVPLKSLIFLTPHSLATDRPILIYSFMDRFELISNTILLKNPEKIRSQASWTHEWPGTVP